MPVNIFLQQILHNPLLVNYCYTPLQSQLINTTFGNQINLPQILPNAPFIFSCFALSIDGKLCYPDTKTGYDIAKSNYHATEHERYADWLYLMIARSISDGIILTQSTSHKILAPSDNDKHNLIHIPELQQDRLQGSKNSNPTAIIFCRDLKKYDLRHQIAANSSIIIITLDTQNNINLKKHSNWLEMTFNELIQQKAQISFNSHQTIVYYQEKTPYTDLINLLSRRFGLNIILNESPHWHHKLLEKQLLNEIWLNYASSYIGGDGIYLGKSQNSFTSINHPDTEILALYHLGYNFLYSRQLVKYPAQRNAQVIATKYIFVYNHDLVTPSLLN